MDGSQIIQRLGARIANLIVEVEMVKQENIELNQLLQAKAEVKEDGISSKNA